MTSCSQYTWDLFELLYDSLLRLGPDGHDELWLAESYKIETNLDNPSVPSGHTRFTFEILQNATWTDGMPLTAEYIAFTFNYYRDAPGNPYGLGLSEMISVYAPTLASIVVEFDTESYWHLHTIAYKPIIPKHVFELIGAENWALWEPNPPTTPMVTSGPFNISDYEPEVYIELTKNENYFYTVKAPEEPTTTTTDTTSTTTTDTTSTTTTDTTSTTTTDTTSTTGDDTGSSDPYPSDSLQQFDSLLLLSLALTMPSLIVIAIVLLKSKKTIDTGTIVSRT